MDSPYTGGPLPLERLTSFEVKLLDDIGQRLIKILHENEGLSGQYKWKQDDPWAQIDRHRNDRILVITGKRGAGKTSLLLTLIHELQGQGDQLRKDAGDNVKGLRSTLTETGKQVHVFHPLDFDPLPESMPLHGWLLQPWSLVVNCLGRTFRSDSCHMDNVDDISNDPREQYRKLFARAVTGWSTTNPLGRSLLEYSLDLFDQTNNWLALRGDWRSFVNDIFARLMSKATPLVLGGPSEKSIVVLPIDDVDLQCERLPELFHALRLFLHPRVVYLLTADLEHAEGILEADYRGRQRKVERAGNNTDRAIGNERDDVSKRELTLLLGARDLAEAQMEKTIPEHDRFPVEPLTLKTMLKVPIEGHKTVKDRLNGISALLKGHKIYLGDELEKLAEMHDIGEVCRFRRLEQSLPDEVALLTTLVTGYVGPPLNREPGPKMLELGQLDVKTEATWVSSDFTGGTIRVGTKLKLKFGALHEGFREPENLYLAALLKDHGFLDAPNVFTNIEEAFVWTSWRSGRSASETIYAWPFLKYPTLIQFHEALGTWAAVAQKLSGNEREEDGLIKWWITYQLSWLRDSLVPDKPFELTALPAEVDKFKDNEKKDRKEVTEWIAKNLCYLCLPEYRLKKEVQINLLRACDRALEKLGRRGKHYLSQSRRLNLASNAYALGGSSRNSIEQASIEVAFLNSLDLEFYDNPVLTGHRIKDDVPKPMLKRPSKSPRR